MPNWCVNQVDADGDAAKIAELVKFVADVDSADEDDKIFSFAKIVPKPDTDRYRMSAGTGSFTCGCVSESRVVGKNDDGTDRYKKYVGGVFADWTATHCPVHNAINTLADPENWYHWNIEHWGSKWDAAEAYQTDYSDGDSCTQYSFDTAWGPAEPVVAALAAKFPELDITHRYCEGGMGFAGQVIYKRGKQVALREYSAEVVGEDGFLKEEDGTNSWERDYDAIPMSEYEEFCDEHFGGVVGG